ncbi:MAG: DegT/DnrJ/EryC1/StrS family aminotransferase [Planctomycetota bacterium]|nr:DegT/DnrJ/EryC1/StrS family aminotransferase [Planctomycetota bacterium]
MPPIVAEEKSQTLAVNGGPKTIDSLEGSPQPKIWHEEFLQVARTWGYSDETIEKIGEAIADEVPPGAPFGGGAFHGRYYNPRPSNVAEFEAKARELLNVKHAYAVSSGTGALHSAFIAADVCTGDEVIIPAYTFFATASAAVVAGGIPVWCEVDESMTMDPADLERKITPRTKVIAPVHMNGYVCDMDAIMKVARQHNLRVVEDCAQAFGASYKGKRVGAFGDFGCYSISCFKVTGGGEAGMLVSNDDRLFDRARNFAEAGGLWRPNRFGHPRWEGELFCGLNYRQSELEGAVNLVQIGKAQKQLDQWRANKRHLLESIPAYLHLQPQTINDIEGEMNHSLGFLPDSRADSEKLSGALRAEGLSAGLRGTAPDWHYADDMWQINQHMSATSDGFPWISPQTVESGGPPDYGENPAPRTKDLSERHLKIGIEKWWTKNDCAKVAEAITKVLDAFYERDGDKKLLNVVSRKR